MNSKNLTFKQQIRKKQSRKYLNRSLMLSLINASNDADMKKRYWNTYHCGSSLEIQTNNYVPVNEADQGNFDNLETIKEIKHQEVEYKIRGRNRKVRSYCNNRYCLICSGLKSAIAFAHYSEIISSWNNKQFLTLTVPNCTADDLEKTVDKMILTVRKINDSYRKKAKKENLNKLMSIRKIEITYNSVADTYHPHFHYIVYDLLQAEYILEKWLKHYPGAVPWAQDIKEADEKSKHELFKYITKLITKKSKDGFIPAAQLDLIFRVLHNRRTIQVQGFRALKIDLDKTGEQPYPVVIKNLANFYIERAKQEFYDWNQDKGDWENKENDLVGQGVKITSYKLALRFEKDLENIDYKNEITTRLTREKYKDELKKGEQDYQNNLAKMRSKINQSLKKRS